MRVLIVRVGAMGDVLHALPAVAALRAARPGIRIGWAIDPRWLPLFRDSAEHPTLVDELFPVPTRAWKQHPLSSATLRSLHALRSALRAQRFDIAIDLQGSLRSALIARLAGARLVAGPATPREWPAHLLYRLRIPASALHVVHQAAAIVSAATGLPLTPAPVPLPRDSVAEEWANNVIAPALTPFVVLVPQAGWGAKQWPAERFGVLAQALAGRGLHVLVNKVSATDALADAVVAASRGAATAILADLPQLIALLRRAALVVAGDTGPLHLAAALDRPALGLFGPTDPARTGPFSAQARVLRHPASVTDHSRHPHTEGGLLQLTTDQVLAAALDLLRSSSVEVPA